MATGGHHNRVNHDRGKLLLRQMISNDAYNCSIAEHTGLDRLNVDIVGKRLWLLADKISRNSVYRIHPLCILRRTSGKDATAIHTMAGEGFMIRLDSCSTAGI